MFLLVLGKRGMKEYIMRGTCISENFVPESTEQIVVKFGITVYSTSSSRREVMPVN
jgi:hypothetical protein